MNESVVLRSFADDDMEIFKKWLSTPHVSAWYHDTQDWIDEVEKRHDEYKWINHYIVMCDEKPVGFCQYYEYKLSGEEWHGDIELEGTYSIDYLIGEADYLKKGIGRRIVLELILLIRRENNAKRIIVQPEADNSASCATLSSAGFTLHDADNNVYLLEL